MLALFRYCCSCFAQRQSFLCKSIFTNVYVLTPPRIYRSSPRPKMIPLMPTLALALVSLLCSAFLILRILLSTLSRHRRPLGTRVYSVRFFISSFPSLSLTLIYAARHRRSSFLVKKLTSSSRLSSSSLPTADKSYVWLAICDIVAVAVFVWEAFGQWFDSSSEWSSAAASSGIRSRSAARLWLALTFRQTCFFIISALILVHVRRRKSVSFGCAHWFLWVPLLFLATVSTVAAGLFADTIPRSFLVGYVAYSTTTAILNTVIFGSLVGSLIIVKRSLANFNQVKESKSPGETTAAEKRRRTVVTAEDIDAIREGSLWIASTASSRRRDEPTGSSYALHSTTSSHTRTTPHNHNTTAPPDQTTPPRIPFPFWPPQATHSSSSSRNPSPRRSDTHANDFGYAPLRSRTQSLRAAAAAAAAALTLSSQGSWISSSLGTHPTLSAWSYPTQRSSPPNQAQTTVEGARALTGEQYAPSSLQAERGTATASPTSAVRSQEIEISTLRILAWLAGVWAPLVCSLFVVTIYILAY